MVKHGEEMKKGSARTKQSLRVSAFRHSEMSFSQRDEFFQLDRNRYLSEFFLCKNPSGFDPPTSSEKCMVYGFYRRCPAGAAEEAQHTLIRFVNHGGNPIASLFGE